MGFLHTPKREQLWLKKRVDQDLPYIIPKNEFLRSLGVKKGPKLGINPSFQTI